MKVHRRHHEKDIVASGIDVSSDVTPAKSAEEQTGVIRGLVDTHRNRDQRRRATNDKRGLTWRNRSALESDFPS